MEQEPVLALFAIACPFGPPSLFELSQRETLFKSKHKVNLGLISLDQRGKLILGYNDSELSQFGGYDLIHTDDLKYYSNAHKELLKTGSSGLVCYRLLAKDETWQWVQSSMRIIYKSNKPECVIANHRPLTAEEGEELYYKRGLEFKLPYPCLNDFEGNFGGMISGFSDEPHFGKNNTNNPSKVVKTNSNASLNAGVPTTSTPKAKLKNKNSENKAHKQNQNRMSLQNQHIPYATDPHLSNDYLNSVKMDVGRGPNLLTEAPPTNEHSSNAENYHYPNYLNGFNTYNYPHYATYSNGLLYAHPNASHQIGAPQDNHTAHATSDNFQFNSDVNNSWFEPNASSSKLLTNNYNIFQNHSNSSFNKFTTANKPAATLQQSYSEFFNNKYPNGYIDEYNSTMNQQLPLNYDYNFAISKYGQQRNSSIASLNTNTSGATLYLNGAEATEMQLGNANQGCSNANSTHNLNKYLLCNINSLSKKENGSNYSTSNSSNEKASTKSSATPSLISSSSVSCSSSSPSSSSSSSTPATALNQITLVNAHENNGYGPHGDVHLGKIAKGAKDISFSNLVSVHDKSSVDNSNHYLMHKYAPLPFLNTQSENENFLYPNQVDKLQQFSPSKLLGDKSQSVITNLHDANSSSSFSASSCSSVSSSSSMFAIESNKFLKQESCMSELPNLLNSTTSLRNGLIKDYYQDVTSFYPSA